MDGEWHGMEKNSIGTISFQSLQADQWGNVNAFSRKLKLQSWIWGKQYEREGRQKWEMIDDLSAFCVTLKEGGSTPINPRPFACLSMAGDATWVLNYGKSDLLKKDSLYARNSPGSLEAPIEDRLSVRRFGLFNGPTSPELIQYRWWCWWWWGDIFPEAEGRKGRIEDKSLLMHAFSILLLRSKSVSRT